MNCYHHTSLNQDL